MKLLFIPTGNAPGHYSFNGDVVTAHYGGQAEAFDLSALTATDQFQGVEADTLDLPSGQIIRGAYRDDAGELHVTLCQRVGAGHWEQGMEFDAAQYDPDAVYVTYVPDKPYAGQATVWTAKGKQAGKADTVLLFGVFVGAAIWAVGNATDSYFIIGAGVGAICVSVGYWIRTLQKLRGG